DALDSKSSTRKSVWVRTPPPVGRTSWPKKLHRQDFTLWRCEKTWSRVSAQDPGSCLPLGIICVLLHLLERIIAQGRPLLVDLGFGGIFLHPMTGDVAVNRPGNPNHFL